MPRMIGQMPEPTISRETARTQAFLREEGGTRSVTEGARVTLSFRNFHCIALSLSRFATAFGPGLKHSLLPDLAKNMPPAYFLNASRPPGGSLS